MPWFGSCDDSPSTPADTEGSLQQTPRGPLALISQVAFELLGDGITRHALCV